MEEKKSPIRKISELIKDSLKEFNDEEAYNIYMEFILPELISSVLLLKEENSSEYFTKRLKELTRKTLEFYSLNCLLHVGEKICKTHVINPENISLDKKSEVIIQKIEDNFNSSGFSKDQIGELLKYLFDNFPQILKIDRPKRSDELRALALSPEESLKISEIISQKGISFEDAKKEIRKFMDEELEKFANEINKKIWK